MIESMPLIYELSFFIKKQDSKRY